MLIQSPEINNKNNNNTNSNENQILFHQTNSFLRPKFLEDDGNYDIYFDNKYHKEKTCNQKVLNRISLGADKFINFYENEKKEIIYPDGSKKEIYNDGYSIVYFANKDVKQVN